MRTETTTARNSGAYNTWVGCGWPRGGATIWTDGADGAGDGRVDCGAEGRRDTDDNHRQRGVLAEVDDQ